MKISKIILWLFVVILGIELGAGLYETLVVLPVWSHNAPRSVLDYHSLNTANPQFALNAGPKFWMFFTPAVGLLAIATLVTSFGTSPLHRKWRIVGSSLAIFVVACTFGWFVPNIMLLLNDPASASAADIAPTAKWWVNLKWGRVVMLVTAWLCTLRAFGIPED